MNHKGTKRIETENLILRKFELSDAEAMYKNWASDSEVTKFLTWNPIDSVEVSKSVIKGWVDDYKNNNIYRWAIVPKDNRDEPVGAISIVRQDEEIGIVQFGYCIGKQWWNKGITSESLSALIKFFINEVKVNRIEARFDPINLNSGKVMIKCAMKYEGTMRKADKNNQGICDSVMYALLAEDYNNELLINLDKLHTTELGVVRIKNNLSLDTDNVVEWCKTKIKSPHATITKNGKNWYINIDGSIITVNSYSYTIITAHKEKK